MFLTLVPALTLARSLAVLVFNEVLTSSAFPSGVLHLLGLAEPH